MAKSDTWFQDTERVLRRYYLTMDRIAVLREKETAILAKIKGLEIEASEIRGVSNITASYSAQPGMAMQSDPGYAKLMVKYDDHWKHVQEKILDRYKELRTLRARIDHIDEPQLPIRNIVDKLGEREQRILLLRYVYNKSNYQIAELVWCSESTVRRSFVKAISFVADRLGKR